MLGIADWLWRKCGAIWRWQSQRSGIGYLLSLIPALYLLLVVFLFSLCFYLLGAIGLLKRTALRGVRHTRMRMRESGFLGKVFWLIPWWFCVCWYGLAWVLAIGQIVNDAETVAETIHGLGS